MSELWSWFAQSIVYVIATAGVAAMFLLFIRFVA
jgi:hypothetical protein